ncbi:A/G-specific adenine glycosylase [bacterium]|nr:A/G-specific adenine glycosylase [bacterium]
MFLNDTHLRTQSTWVDQLLNWYDIHKRDFPWRRDISTYRTWICEVMSQQTTMAVVVPRFESFVKTLPTVKALAEASDDLLRELWAGLGYYARARNLRAGARYIVSECAGQFPNSFEAWLNVPGVGPYTASVISSICFNIPKGCVDGNVIRVIARLSACDSLELWSDAGRKAVQETVDACIAQNRPGDFNQAMMELGATVCQKQSPDCLHCPVQRHCLANQRAIIKGCPSNKPRKSFVDVDLTALHISGPFAQANAVHSAAHVANLLLVERGQGFLTGTVGFLLADSKQHIAVLGFLRDHPLVESCSLGSDSVNHTITHHHLDVKILNVVLKGVSISASERTLFLENLASSCAIPFSSPAWVSKTQAQQSVASSLDRKIWEKIS